MTGYDNFYTCYLMGGLGNQMFQISHALCQGWKYNVESKFMPVASTPMQANQPTKYLNNIFRNINFTLKNRPSLQLTTGFKYFELSIPHNESVEFYGYFQSNKNFLGYDDKIKDIFKPTDEFVELVLSKYPEIKYDNTVSLHIRRGDYLTIDHILPVIDKSYVNRSLELLGDYDHIFIFSDDKEYIKNNYNYKNQTIVSDLEDFEELWMISLCKNNIMSNSSFSWWGSFLNQNKNKKVFVPSVWFGPSGETEYQDIYLDEWTKVDVVFSNGSLISNL